VRSVTLLPNQIDGGHRWTFHTARNLKAKVDEVVTSAGAAAAEDREQLKQRVDQAQDEANKAVADARQRADQVADRAESKWAQMMADAAARREDIKARIDKRADQLDAVAAATDADWAEQDAADGIDYAVLVVSDAQLAVLDALDALDARAYADERAKIASSLALAHLLTANRRTVVAAARSTVELARSCA